MTSITSKRHIIRFYGVVSLAVATFFAMGTASLYVFIKFSKTGEFAPTYFAPFFAIVLYFMTGYTVYRYFKNTPIVKVDNEKISFDDEVFYWTTYKSIELTGKKPFKFPASYSTEATTIHFEDDVVRFFFDDMYSNSPEIKLFIQQVILNKKEFQNIENRLVSSLEIEADYFDTFKGNQFISLRGISLWGMFAFIFYITFFPPNDRMLQALPFTGIYLIAWFILNSWFMHYFKVSDNLVVIKNHNFFWKTKAYDIADIKEIVFETRSKWPDCLRVITNNFQSRLYPAGTLNKKTWLRLKET